MAITATKPRVNTRRTTNSFLWADLQAKDLQAALDFYGRTLGWEFRDEQDGSSAMVYHTAHVGGVTVAGIGEMQAEAKASGMPSTWTDYVYVKDVDAVCAAATRLGGRVTMPAMDVMDQGRMAIVLDTTGAAFGVWQPAKHQGADAFMQPSTLSWTELYTSDVVAARAFYGSLFGWTWEAMKDASGSEMEYWMGNLDGRPIAGLMPKPTEMGEAPDSWGTYFGVANVETTATEVTAAGGTVLWGPMQTGPGRSIGVLDPQGAMVTCIQMDEWPAD